MPKLIVETDSLDKLNEAVESLKAEGVKVSATDFGNLDEQLATIKTENEQLANANKEFTNQIGTLTERANQVNALNEQITQLTAAKVAAEQAHTAEQAAHATTQGNTLNLRRTLVSVKHGVPIDKVKDMSEEGLKALEATLPVVTMTGKGLDLGNGGGGSPESRTPTENASRVLAAAKERAGIKVS